MTTTAAHGAWIDCWRPRPAARGRLICLPHVGGGSSLFRKWADGVGPDIEVCGVQLPGRENRLLEPPFGSLRELSVVLAAILAPLTAMPFAVFGHSMGALLAFELTRELRRHGRRPAHLFVAGSRAPQIPRLEPPRHLLPQPEFVNELQRLGGTPPEVLSSPDLMDLFSPGLRGDFSMCDTYVYTDAAPLDCPISVYGGAGDVEVGVAELEAWRCQTTGPFRVRVFPGDHFFLNTARPALLRSIADAWRASEEPAYDAF